MRSRRTKRFLSWNVLQHRAGAGDETRLLANEWGPQVKSVKVYWHILREGKAYSQGNVPRDAINKQIAVLNQKFAAANIQFSVSACVWHTDSHVLHILSFSKGSLSSLPAYGICLHMVCTSLAADPTEVAALLKSLTMG